MTPAIYLPHGPGATRAAQRAAHLARFDDTVTATDLAGLSDAVTRIAALVSGHSEIVVVHIVDVGTDGVDIDGLAAALVRVHDLLATFPALNHNQWIVAAVGRQWSEDGIGLAELTRTDHGAQRLVVVSRSSEAGALLTGDEESAMVSDIVHALVTTELENSLGDTSTWLMGAVGVYYRPAALISALAAFFTKQKLEEHFLAPARAEHPFGQLARQQIDQRELGGADHRDSLQQNAAGSVLAELRVDPTAFGDTPIEVLPDALRSYFDQLVFGPLRRAEKQIAQNADAHFASVSGYLEHETVRVLRDSVNFAETEAFLRSMDEALIVVEEDLQREVTERREELPTVHDELLEDLEKAILGLPYRFAVWLRASGYVALGVAGFAVVALILGMPAYLAPLGAIAGAAAAVPVLLAYRAASARVRELRGRYLREVENFLVARAELHLVETMAEEVRRLRGFVVADGDSLVQRLSALRAQVEELRRRYDQRAETRETDELWSTRFSVMVPRASDVSTSSLAVQFSLPPGYDLMTVLRPAILVDDDRIGPFDPEHVDRQIVDAVHPLLERKVWLSLADLLDQSPHTGTGVNTVLRTLTVPLVGHHLFIEASNEIRRLLFAGTPGDIDAALLRGVDHDGDPRHCADANSILLVAARPVPSARAGEREANDDDE